MSEQKADKSDGRFFLRPTPEFRVSHPHVFKPQAVKKGSDKMNYSIEMLYPKATTKLKVLQAPLIFAATQMWGDKEDWPDGLRFAIKDGDKPRFNKKAKKKEIKKEHKGMWVVKASSSAEFTKPYVVGKNPEDVITEPAEFYPGCWARAALKSHAYDVGDQIGVKFILDGVQFIRDDEPLGGRKRATEVFGVVEDAEGDDGDSFEMDAGEDEGEEAFT